MALTIAATYQRTDNDLSTPHEPFTYEIKGNLTNGEGASKAEVLYSDTITASDGGTTIDVFGGITDVYTTTLNLKQIKGLLIVNKSVATGEYVDFGGNAQTLAYLTGITDEIRIWPGTALGGPGILFLWSPGANADGPSPGAGSADEILITAAAGKTPEIDIVLFGDQT